MKTWFTNKLQESGKVKDEEVQEVIGNVGLWPVQSLQIILRSESTIDYANFLNNYSFTTKEAVQKQRLEFIKFIKEQNTKPILIH